MGIRSKLKTAGKIASAPGVGAYKGLVKTGAAPAVGTVKGALRGDKSDIALVSLAAASVIPAGRVVRAAGILRTTKELPAGERLALAARSTMIRKPLFHGTTASAAEGIYKSGFKGKDVFTTPQAGVASVYASLRGKQFGERPAVVLARATKGAKPVIQGENYATVFSKASEVKAARPLRRATAMFASERGALSLDKYMKEIRIRYEQSRFAPGSMNKALELRARARQAAANTPKGYIFEATGVKVPGGVASAFSDAGGTMASEAGTATRSVASIRSGQRQKALVAGVAIDTRMSRGKKQPLLKGFYEKLNDESGMLRFPDKPGNAVRRMRTRVMKGIAEAKAEIARPKELEQKHAAVIKELRSSSTRANETTARTLKEIVVESHGEKALKWPLKNSRKR